MGVRPGRVKQKTGNLVFGGWVLAYINKKKEQIFVGPELSYCGSTCIQGLLLQSTNTIKILKILVDKSNHK